MVERLNDIIKDRYGKGFSVRQLSGVDSLSFTEASVRGDDLYIPIVVKDLFLGYGLVHKAQDLSTEQQAHLSRLVRMILEPALYSQHLERTLHNMEIEKSLGTAPYSAGPIKSIFVFGHHASRVQKIAMEIHEISENWSYLPFKDIATSLNTPADLTDLGNSTLVVNLEDQLSPEKQNLLIEYIEKSPKGAFLIFTASRPSYQLFESGLIDSPLHEFLKASEFSIDRLPIERKTLRDVLEMLYLQS